MQIGKTGNTTLPTKLAKNLVNKSTTCGRGHDKLTCFAGGNGSRYTSSRKQFSTTHSDLRMLTHELATPLVAPTQPNDLNF